MMVMGFSTVTQAHPHHWIDVYAVWQFDNSSRITGVKMRWLFDDYYSVLLVDDAVATGKDKQALLDKILENVGKHHYFLNITQQDKKADFGVLEQARIGTNDYRVEIEFYLPMKSPLNLKHGEVVYQIAEPTYFFETLHAEEGPAIVLKNAPPGCRYRLEPPKPDAALVAYAASLGINDTGGSDLGIQFAETVTIQCD